MTEATLTKKILVVDDDLLFRELLSRLFTVLECAPELAGDGLEALEKLKSDSFDLVISDIRMPSMDGLTLLRTIQSTSRPLPVILISSEPAHKSEAMAAGADLFLDKSQLTLRNLRELLNRL